MVLITLHGNNKGADQPAHPFESYLVRKPKDRGFCNEAHIYRVQAGP